MKATAQDLIGLLFASREYAHREHLNTDSYAKHKALQGFYTGIVDLADDFAEAWMGRNGERIVTIPAVTVPKGNPVTVMERLLKVIRETRGFADDDSVLSNILDEIEQLFSVTIYKLKFLQ